MRRCDRRSLLSLLPAALLVAALAWLPAVAGEPPAAGAAAETVDVTILHINDPHGHLEPYMEDGKSVGGYARLSTLVDEIRKSSRAARVFLVHAGDEFSRGDDLTRATLGAANLDILNLLKFDLWVPGNGDYYDGADNLRARIRQARFPVLAANVKFKPSGDPVGKPYVIEKAGPVRMAFFGICWLKPQHDSFNSFQVADQTATARLLVPELRKQADVVVGVMHYGAPLEKRLAETVGGIDVLLGAHTHTVLPTGVRVKGLDGRETLICQGGLNMHYLGRLDLKLKRLGAAWQIESASDVLIPIDDKVKLDPAVTARIAKLAAEAPPLPPEAKTPPAKPQPVGAGKGQEERGTK